MITEYTLYIGGNGIGSDSLDELLNAVSALRADNQRALKVAEFEADALRKQNADLNQRLADAGNAQLRAEHGAAIEARDQALRDLDACRKQVAPAKAPK